MQNSITLNEERLPAVLSPKVLKSPRSQQAALKDNENKAFEACIKGDLCQLERVLSNYSSEQLNSIKDHTGMTLWYVISLHYIFVLTC
jgi:hypothetical protein